MRRPRLRHTPDYAHVALQQNMGMKIMARRRYWAVDGGIGALWSLQLQTAKLGMNWLEMTMGAAQVIATRSAMMGAAAMRPAGLAHPEMALMVTEKLAAVGEAAERWRAERCSMPVARSLCPTPPPRQRPQSDRRPPHCSRSSGG